MHRPRFSPLIIHRPLTHRGGAGARRGTRPRNSDAVEKVEKVEKQANIRFSSSLVTSFESSLTSGNEAKADGGQVQVSRVNREMKPASTDNPSIENGDEGDQRRSSGYVTVKQRSIYEQELIEEIDAESKMNEDSADHAVPRQCRMRDK